MSALCSLHPRLSSGWCCPTKQLQLTTHSTAILVKLSHQKFMFHGIQKFIRISKKPATWSHPEPYKTNPHTHAYYQKSISTLPFHLIQGILNGYLLSGFLTKTQYAICLLRACCMFYPSLCFITLIKPTDDFQLCILLFSLLFPLLKSNYSTQHLNFEHLPPNKDMKYKVHLSHEMFTYNSTCLGLKATFRDNINLTGRLSRPLCIEAKYKKQMKKITHNICRHNNWQ